jgi:hypothetical protein
VDLEFTVSDSLQSVARSPSRAATCRCQRYCGLNSFSPARCVWRVERFMPCAQAPVLDAGTQFGIPPLCSQFVWQSLKNWTEAPTTVLTDANAAPEKMKCNMPM